MNAKQLIKEALKAQKRAKAQYSEYPVGAALLTKNDEIILGCNVESKAYPTTLCAERVAIFSALAQGYADFKSIAIITLDGGNPCGSCRQIMYEYLNNIPIYIGNNKNNNFQTYSVNDLLPYPFGK